MPIPNRTNISECRLYGILDLSYTDPAQLLPVAQAMLDGGVQIVQLRAKHHTPDNILRMANSVGPLCRASNVPFIVNDHPALVAAAGADGVHVGQDDTPVADARLLAGPGAIVGKSSHSIAQAQAAANEQPDYLGFGPLFATPTKPDYIPTGLRDIAEVHRTVSLPVFCIGGIKLENLPEVLAAGARRVVVVSGILQAPDVRAYCQALRKELDAGGAIRE